LDKFAADAKANPFATFMVHSHADNVESGKDNMALTDKRMKAVQAYLDEKHKMPEFRSLTFSEGENAPHAIIIRKKAGLKIDVWRLGKHFILWTIYSTTRSFSIFILQRIMMPL
jgi:hypothetical protein